MTKENRRPEAVAAAIQASHRRKRVSSNTARAAASDKMQA
jgi:hypothetical protein